VIDEHTDKRRSSFWRELPILLGVAILVAFVVKTFVLQTFYIPSPSMEHTLDINDRVLVNKLVYDFRDPRRGEIIVFEAPAEWRSTREGEDFIKRVIGVAGDRVQCCDKEDHLMVNGKSLIEPYLFSEDGIADPPADQPFDVTVPKGRIFVMGDHRAASADSRVHLDFDSGTIPLNRVVGRAFVIFWPANRAGTLSPPATFDDVPSPPKG
jgi:signal peptidase I